MCSIVVVDRTRRQKDRALSAPLQFLPFLETTATRYWNTARSMGGDGYPIYQRYGVVGVGGRGVFTTIKGARQPGGRIRSLRWGGLRPSVGGPSSVITNSHPTNE